MCFKNLISTYHLLQGNFNVPQTSSHVNNATFVIPPHPYFTAKQTKSKTNTCNKEVSSLGG